MGPESFPSSAAWGAGELESTPKRLKRPVNDEAPVLTRKDYYTIPPLKKLKRMPNAALKVSLDCPLLRSLLHDPIQRPCAAIWSVANRKLGIGNAEFIAGPRTLCYRERRSRRGAVPSTGGSSGT